MIEKRAEKMAARIEQDVRDLIAGLKERNSNDADLEELAEKSEHGPGSRVDRDSKSYLDKHEAQPPRPDEDPGRSIFASRWFEFAKKGLS